MMQSEDGEEDLIENSPPIKLLSTRKFTRNKLVIFSGILATIVIAISIIILVVYFSIANRSPSSKLSLSSDPDTRVVQMLQKYIRIKTAQPTPDYKAATDFLMDVASFFHFPAEVFQVNTTPYVIMTIKGQNPELQSVVLLSHMDTVPVQMEYWNYDPFGGVMDADGNIYGRGAQDMKSIGIQYLEAMYRLVQSGTKFQRTVYLLFAPDEEIGINSKVGMHAFVTLPKWSNMRAGIVLDEGMPSPQPIYTVFYGQRAIFQPTLIFEGPAGHGSLFINDTAISKLEVVLSESMRFRRDQQTKMISNNLSLGQVTSVNPTAVHGAVIANGIYTKNSVPPQAMLVLDFRISPLDAPYVEQMISNWSKLGNVTIDQLKVDVIPEIDLATDPWWPVLRGSLESMNLTVVTDIFPAATDGRVILKLKQNITVFCFSPLPNTHVLLHDHNEYVNNRTLISGVAVYEKIIYNLANHV